MRQIVDHGVLHRHLDLLAAAGHRALEERGQHADGGVQSRAGVAERHAGLDRPAVVLARDRHHAARGLRDHVERQVRLVGAAFAEALDRRIDDARVELGHLLVGEAQLLDHARREVLGEDVGLLDEARAACPCRAGPSD